MFRQFLIIMCLFTMAVGTTLEGSNNSTRNMRNIIAKPGCPTKCGNVIIPYPFGIGSGCSLNNSFYVTCNMSEKPPKLFLGSTNIQILNISDSEVRVPTEVASSCYYPNGSLSNETSGSTRLKTIFSDRTFSISKKNMLTVIGCDDYGVIGDDDGSYTGCIGLCSRRVNASDGSCSGEGCCQTSIKNGFRYYNITLNSFSNHTDIWYINACGYAFLGEAGTIKFHGDDDLSDDSGLVKRVESTVQVVINWFLDRPVSITTNCTPGMIYFENKCYAQPTCGQMATVCKENSQCYDVESGYRCKCNQGYEGNPYLDQGCQGVKGSILIPGRPEVLFFTPLVELESSISTLSRDINECEDRARYPCHGNCNNTPGSYKCTCPLGYVGNATLPGGCERHVIVRRSRKFPIIFILLGVFLGTGILVLAIWMSKVVRKRKDKKRREKFFKRNGGLLLQQQTSNGEDAIETTRMFSARELEKATDQYNNNRILGRGGQGTVYKGMLPNGKIVAVKKSVLMDETQVESFINEVFLLSQISHRNVVKLLGCCLETEVPVLVYEFVSNGSLFQFIHDENYEFPTLWSIRITIATEVAGALAYMHSATSIPIYHRDIKSSNILLDEKFRAKLSDFGISKSVMGDQTHLSTVVKGTYGYLDPEYFQSNQFTEKSDVYSFGIVLVELLTGKKPIYSTGPGESRSLATLILSMEEGLILENIDDRVLDGPKAQLIAVAKLAKRCLNLNGKQRPTMKDVATELEGIRSSSP